MEASGGYERTAFLLLWEAGVACGMTNPRSVRHYAKAMGVLEKTDRLDAGRHRPLRHRQGPQADRAADAAASSG